MGGAALQNALTTTRYLLLSLEKERGETGWRTKDDVHGLVGGWVGGGGGQCAGGGEEGGKTLVVHFFHNCTNDSSC